MRTSIALPTLGILLALASCGGDDSTSSASAGNVDACALLTLAEIEEATGIAPGTGKDPEPPGGVSACNWPSADGSDAAFLTLLVAPSGNYGSFEAAMTSWRASAEDMGFEFDPDEYQEVEGVGDFGAWQAGMLQAHRGQRMVQITAAVAPERTALDASAELARHALARLP